MNFIVQDILLKQQLDIIVLQKSKILDIACKLADHIDDVFGSEDGKIHGYDGHEEIELALLRLFELTKMINIRN